MSTHLTNVSTGAVAPVEEVGGVSGLIRLALEKNVDVEVLERLVALQERVTERNARAAFFEAVAAFQEECPTISKSKTADIVSKRTGSKFSYSYAPLEEVTRTIRPILKRHGLSYSWDVDEGEKSLKVSCVLRHIEGHSERASFPVPVEVSERMSAAQSNGAALTYGRRQSLIAVLGITTADEDKDGEHTRQGSQITDRQAADLSALIDEVAVDREKFLKWLRVESLEDLNERDYQRAVKALEDRRQA